MDTMEHFLDSSAIVKQELIIDDLELHDYEHLLQEFYTDQPEEHAPDTAEVQVKAEPPDLEESFEEHIFVENPFAVQNEDPTLPLGPDGLWHCPMCPRTYKWKISCEAHIRKHRWCEVCSMLFTTPAAFDVHNRIVHGIEASSPTKQPRPLAPTPSPGKRRLSPIAMQRDENGLFTCSECGKSFEKENSYFVHVRRHKDKRKERFFCQPCGKPLPTEPVNEQHSPSEPIRCCATPVSDEPRLASLEGEACELLIQIFDADEIVYGSDQVDLEILEDTPCFSDLISEDVASSVTVKEEYATGNDDDGTALVDVLHSRVEIISELPKGGGFKRTAKPIHRPDYAQRCPVCKVWYHTAAGLERHLKRHELDQGKNRKLKVAMKREIPKDNAAPKTKPNFYCERCDKSYGSKHKYYLHKTRHDNIDSARFTCSQCSKVLGSKQELIIHDRRTHESIPSKSDEKQPDDLPEQTKPFTILLEDILLKQEAKLQKTLLKQIVSGRRRIRHKKGRTKGSRKCPMCYEWFLTQEELQEHYSVHVNNDKQVASKTEEKIVDIKIKGQIPLSRPDVKKVDVTEDKKMVKLKPELLPPQRRKVGRPPGSRNLGNRLELKPRFLERRSATRQNGALNSSIEPQPKSESKLPEPEKVEQPSATRDSLNSEAPSSERRKRGRPPGSRSSLNLQSEQTEPERRKRGRPKGNRKCTSPIVMRPESSPPEPRRVGRPRKSLNGSPTVSADKGLPPSAECTSKARKLKINPLAKNSNLYCERCDKKCLTHKNYKLHQIRHLNVDSGCFRCDPCSKSFASKLELDAHVANGHRFKRGRPRKVGSPCPETKFTEREADRHVPVEVIRRKVGRPKKQQTLHGKGGRPKGSKKCPLCKVWSFSADAFKEHLQSHI